MFNPDFSSAIRVIDTSTSKTGTIFELIEYIKPSNDSTYNATTTHRYCEHAYVCSEGQLSQYWDNEYQVLCI